jgi:hypothetical protein
MRQLSRRFIEHLCQANNSKTQTYVARCFRSLLANGVLPIIQQIDEAREDWAEREGHWIEVYRVKGASLTNLTEGGEGIPGHIHSGATRQVMSVKAKLRFSTPEGRAHLSVARKGKKDSPETRELKGLASRGRVYPPEVRAKFSAGHLGIVPSIDVRAKMSAAAKARGPETRKTQAAAMRRLFADPAYKAARKAVWDDPGYKAARSAAKKAACDRPEFRARMAEITRAAAARRRAAKQAAEDAAQPTLI